MRSHWRFAVSNDPDSLAKNYPEKTVVYAGSSKIVKQDTSFLRIMTFSTPAWWLRHLCADCMRHCVSVFGHACCAVVLLVSSADDVELNASFISGCLSVEKVSHYGEPLSTRSLANSSGTLSG